ncbi:MAG: hypothetical protein ACPL1B_10665 [Thermoprotei archaeon]
MGNKLWFSDYTLNKYNNNFYSQARTLFSSIKNNINFPKNHLLGWIVISGKDDEKEIKNKIEIGLNSFIGDYGLIKIINVKNEFGFGLLKPEKPLPMTTWSFFDDEYKCCFIDGVFYDDYFSYRPKEHEDSNMAKILLDKFSVLRTKAIEALNGSFCGFIYDYKNKELITFVDRLGTKILFYSIDENVVVVSTSLSAFRGLKNLTIDELSAFQYLTIGFPIGERTLLNEVKIQLPHTINIYKGLIKDTISYWDIPERLENISLKESVEMICKSMEEHVERIYNRTGEDIGLALSGGHDSRVILNALVYKDIPFKSLTWRDNNFNDKVVLKITDTINKPLVIAKDISLNQLDELQKMVFVYSDGYYLTSYGFPRIAKECYEKGIKYLMVGFSGDKLSGSLTIPAPQYLKNVRELAKIALDNQMELLSFETAQLLLKNEKNDIIEKTVSEWERSFFIYSFRKYLTDVAILQGFNNRNLKRIRFQITPALQYTQIIYPYLDNKVLDSYFTLPSKFLNNQKAHCYAGFYRIKKLGKYQAGGYPISLKTEALYPYGLYLIRVFNQKFNNLLSNFKLTNSKWDWENYHHNIIKEVLQSILFNSNFLKRLLERKKIKPKDLHKIHTLSRFYDFYICKNNNNIPLRFLINSSFEKPKF